MKIFNLTLMGIAVMAFVLLSNCTPKVEEEPTVSQPDYVGTWEGTNNNFFGSMTFQQSSFESWSYTDNNKTTIVGGNRGNLSVNGNIMALNFKQSFNTISQKWEDVTEVTYNAMYSISNNVMTITMDIDKDGDYNTSKGDTQAIFTKK